MSSRFTSLCRKVDDVAFPDFAGLRVMMMPIVHSRPASVPAALSGYGGLLERLFDASREYAGQTVYITIDEAHVEAGRTHRRPGLHVDGVYRGASGGWGGGGGGWGGGRRPGPSIDGARTSGGTGMVVAASVLGCRAWNQDFDGEPDDEGGCEALRGQLRGPAQVDMMAGAAYWADGLCVHESLPMTQDTKRQFVRLSLPSDAPWFEGYDANPLGVKPTGPVLPRRAAFMDFRPNAA